MPSVARSMPGHERRISARPGCTGGGFLRDPVRTWSDSAHDDGWLAARQRDLNIEPAVRPAPGHHGRAMRQPDRSGDRQSEADAVAAAGPAFEPVERLEKRRPRLPPKPGAAPGA